MHTHKKSAYCCAVMKNVFRDRLLLLKVRSHFENFHSDVNAFIKSFILSFHPSSLFLFVFSSLSLLVINSNFHKQTTWQDLWYRSVLSTKNSAFCGSNWVFIFSSYSHSLSDYQYWFGVVFSGGRQSQFSWAETSRWGCGICHIPGFILKMLSGVLEMEKSEF